MRIVLSRTDRIGDLVLSTPAISTVRQSFPDAHITMVASAYNAIVMERNDDVDEVLVLPRDVKPSAFGRRFRGYDIAIALAPRREDLELIGATRAPIRVGYTYVRRYLARLTLPLFANRRMVSEADPDLCERQPLCHVRHESDQLLDLVALAGARDRVERLSIDVRDEDRRGFEALPADPIVFHLGQRWLEVGSTLESTRRLLTDLRSLGHPLLMTYAPDCQGPADDLCGSVDLCLGNLPFHRWAAVFERAACIVTVDTGATHIASAMRRPTVVAFEHRYFRLNSQEWAPYRVPNRLVRKPESESDEALAQFSSEIIDAVTDLLHGKNTR